MPVRRAIAGTVRVHLFWRNHPATLRDKQPAREPEFPEVIQLYPDRVTVQPATPGVPALPRVPRLDVERYQLEHLPLPTDHHVSRGRNVRAGQEKRGTLGTRSRRVVQHDHVRPLQTPGVLRAHQVNHPATHQTMVDN